MDELYDKAAENFLELASSQRLHILFKLLANKCTPTEIPKDLIKSDRVSLTVRLKCN